MIKQLKWKRMSWLRKNYQCPSSKDLNMPKNSLWLTLKLRFLSHRKWFNRAQSLRTKNLITRIISMLMSKILSYSNKTKGETRRWRYRKSCVSRSRSYHLHQSHMVGIRSYNQTLDLKRVWFYQEWSPLIRQSCKMLSK